MDPSRSGVIAGALAVGSTLAGATGNRIYGDSRVCDSEDCRVTEKPERFGRHSIVIVERQPSQKEREQYHLECIPTELLSSMQKRSCSISKQENPHLLIRKDDSNTSTPIEIDVCREGDKEALQLLLEYNCLNDDKKQDSATVSAGSSQYECLELLLDNGAKVNTPNIKTGRTLLCQAALDGDSKCIKLLLEKGADANISDNDGNTALHLAAQNGQTDSVKAILDIDHNRIDPKHIFQLAVRFKNKENKTARDLAIQNGHREVAKACRGFLAKILKMALSEESINIDYAKDVVGIDHSLARDTDNNGNTPLHQAAESGRTNIVKAWLAIDSSLVEETNDGNTALHLAAQNGHTDTVQAFLESPRIQHLNLAKGKNGNTALHLAAQNGHSDTIQAFFQAFLKSSRIQRLTLIKDKNNDGNTALHLAAQNGHIKTVMAFLDKRRLDEEDILSKRYDKIKDLMLDLAIDENDNCNTALCLSAQNGYTDTVRAMLNMDFINDALEDPFLLEYVLKAYQKANLNGHPETATALRSPLFHLAATNGDTRLVGRLLEIDDSLARKRNKRGDMALHLAALKSHTGTVKALLYHDPSLAKDTGFVGKTPLHRAAQGGEECLSKECFELLLGTGADIDATDDYGNTPLHHAACSAHSGCVKLLLDARAVIKANNEGKTPLHDVTEGYEDEKCKECVELLTKAGADIDATDNDGNTPLNNAAASGLFGCGKFLLDAGADIIKVNLEGESPLHMACYGGNHPYVRLLIEKGADINAADKSGNTPLHLAAEHESTKCMKLLLDAGAIIKSNKRCETPTILATPKCKDLLQAKEAAPCFDKILKPEQIEQLCSVAKKDNVQKLKDLLRTWLNIKVSDDNGKTALHYIAEYGGVECLKHLKYNCGANINLPDNSKKTACHYAAKNGHLECLKYLFECGVDINHTDGVEKSVLYYAIEYEIKNVASNAKDESNKETCLDYLSSIRHEFSSSNILRALKLAINKDYFSHKIKAFCKIINLSVKDRDDKTLLHLAAVNHRYLREFLPENKPEEALIIKDKEDRYPLHYAALAGKHDSIATLLRSIDTLITNKYQTSKKYKEFDKHKLMIINDKDIDGNTAMHLAAQNNRETCVVELIKQTADMKVKNHLDWTLLHYIARSENKNEWLKFEKEFYKEDFNDPDVDGNTPVHHAAYKGNKAFLERVHDKFEDKEILNTPNDESTRPLHMAIQGDKVGCLELMIKYMELDKDKVKVKVKDKVKDEECTKLFLYAAAHGKPKCLKTLYERELVNIKYRDQHKMTPLHYVVKDDCWTDQSITDWSKEHQGYTECFRFLIEKRLCNEYINSQNDEDKTPVHLAAEANNIECLNMLLEQEGNNIIFTLEDNDGKTPLQLAKENGHTKCIEIIEKYIQGGEVKKVAEARPDKSAKSLPGQYSDYRRKGESSAKPGEEEKHERIRYKEKYFVDDEDLSRAIKEEKYKGCKFIKIKEHKTLGLYIVYIEEYLKALKIENKSIKFGYSGIRDDNNPLIDFNKIYVPGQFIKMNNSYRTNLPLDGFLFHIEGTKKEIAEFLDEYAKKGFFFKAKSKDQSKPKVFVNINLCLDDYDCAKILRESITGIMLKGIATPATELVNQFIGHIQECDFEELKDTFRKIYSGAKNVKKTLQNLVLETAGGIHKAVDDKASKKPKEVVQKSLREFIDKIDTTNLEETLSKKDNIEENNFSFLSGHIDLLTKIKDDQKIHIAFDRLESNESPARLQLSSTDGRVYFENISKALKILFDIKES